MIRLLILGALAIAAGCSIGYFGEPTAGSSQQAFAINARLARTVNLAGDLELEWDADPMEPAPDAADIAEIAERGFSAVRIPIDFASWASLEPPYEIDTAIFDEVDPILAAAEASGLAAIVDLHHYEAINNRPDANADRLVALWRQIAERYRHLPVDSVAFEVLNEPAEALTTDRWNPLLARMVEVIREIDPERTLIVGPGDYYHVSELANFELPDDPNLIATVHFYEPYPFTHQGADFAPGADAYVGRQFEADGEDAADIRAKFDVAAQWADDRGVPMFVGEFGAIRLAEQEDREAWTRTVRQAAEDHGFSWAYWDWAAPNFGLRVDGAWDEGVLRALGLD